MFPYKVITTFEEAEEYRDNLDADGEAYLKAVDKVVAEIQDGEPFFIPREVKPSNLQKFWLAFSYILLAINKDIAISDDYLTVRIIPATETEKRLFKIAC